MTPFYRSDEAYSMLSAFWFEQSPRITISYANKQSKFCPEAAGYETRTANEIESELRRLCIRFNVNTLDTLQQSNGSTFELNSQLNRCQH